MDMELVEESSETGPGDSMTVSNFDATVSGEAFWLLFYISGTNHDDTFRLSNVHLTYYGYVDVEPDIFVGSYEGHDTIVAATMSVISTTEAAEGELNFNQTWLNFNADTVHIRNLDFVVGGTFTGGFIGGTYITGGSVVVVGDDVDLQNVFVHTNGFGGLGIDTRETWVDGVARDGAYKLANVSVTSASGVEGGFYLAAGGGNDGVDGRNSSLETVQMDLGEGNDRLTFVSVTFDAKHLVFPWGEFGDILTGGGDDAVSMTNCHGENLYLDTGDRDDTVSLANCAFVAADLFGVDGTDHLTVTNNTGPFTINGFEW